jgi:hypothetical protein
MSSEITVISPKTLDESEKLSTTLSKSALLPESLRGKTSDILATLLAGAELGLAPMQAIRGIVIIKGKPSLSADLMGALVKRNSDLCEYLQLVETTATKATYRTKRKGEPEPTTMSFTLSDAQAAGIAGDMYRKYPAQMLRARCLASICRAVYPDLCMGLYDSDSGELTDGLPYTPPPAPKEKEVNPPPVAPNAHASAVKQQLKRSLPIVDVNPGETEAEATKRQASTPPAAEPDLEQQLKDSIAQHKAKSAEAMSPPKPAPKEPSNYERILILAKEYGLGEEATKSTIRGATNKRTPSQITAEDVTKVRDALEALRKVKEHAAVAVHTEQF